MCNGYSDDINRSYKSFFCFCLTPAFFFQNTHACTHAHMRYDAFFLDQLEFMSVFFYQILHIPKTIFRNVLVENQKKKKMKTIKDRIDKRNELQYLNMVLNSSKCSGCAMYNVTSRFDKFRSNVPSNHIINHFYKASVVINKIILIFFLLQIYAFINSYRSIWMIM